jgi:hypothetical protein
MPVIHHLPEINMASSTTGCCPKFDPKPWDEQEFEFEHKKFVKLSVQAILHMPVGLDRAITEAQEQIQRAGASDPEYVMLSRDITPWRSEYYLAVTKDVPGADMAELSGKFMTKVFEGSFREAGNWYKQIAEYAQGKGRTLKDTYFYYTTCPKCAKEYGKNYVVGFAQVA